MKRKTKRNPAGDLFGKPESVAEQKARVARWEWLRKQKEQRQSIEDRARRRLIGKRGDIGQGDLLGGGDLFSLKSNPMSKYTTSDPRGKLVPGLKLDAAQRKQVLAYYPARPTKEAFRSAGKRQPVSIALQTDKQWLAERAFYIKPRGAVNFRAGIEIIHPGEFVSNPMKKRSKARKGARKGAKASKPAKAAKKLTRRSKTVRTVEVVKTNPRKRRKTIRRRKAAVSRRPTPKRRPAAKRRAKRTASASLVAINSGSRVILCRASGSRVKRLGTFTRKGLKAYCAKHGIKTK